MIIGIKLFSKSKPTTV